MDEEADRRKDEQLREILDDLENDEVSFGIITQTGYQDLEKRFHKWFLTGMVAFVLLGLTTVAAGFGFSYLLGQIQKNRERFIHDNCSAQNTRNTVTVTKLTELTNEAANEARSQGEKRRINQSLEGSLAIINALVPVQDCDMLVKVARGEAEAPPPEPQPKEPKKKQERP